MKKKKKYYKNIQFKFEVNIYSKTHGIWKEYYKKRQLKYEGEYLKEVKSLEIKEYKENVYLKFEYEYRKREKEIEK